MASEEEVREDYMANRWDAAGGRQQTRLFAKYFLETVRLPEASKTLLDVGCAKGDAIPEFHRRYPQLKLFASDISEVAIGDARSSYGHLAEIKIHGIDEVSGHYDIIYCSNTLEHFGNYLDVAADLLKHCKWLYILTPYQETSGGKPLVADGPGYVSRHVVTYRDDSFNPLIDREEALSVESKVFYAPIAWGKGPTPWWKKPLRNFKAFLRRKPRPRQELRQIVYQVQSRLPQLQLTVIAKCPAPRSSRIAQPAMRHALVGPSIIWAIDSMPATSAGCGFGTTARRPTTTPSTARPSTKKRR